MQDNELIKDKRLKSPKICIYIYGKFYKNQKVWCIAISGILKRTFSDITLDTVNTERAQNIQETSTLAQTLEEYSTLL